MGYTTGLRNIEAELTRKYPEKESEIVTLLANIERMINTKVAKWEK